MQYISLDMVQGIQRRKAEAAAGKKAGSLLDILTGVGAYILKQ